MNTNYILMCREAKELQEQWKPKPGDRIYNPMPSIHAKYNIDILNHYFKNENGGHDIERVLINENLSFLGYSTVQSESDIKTRFKWVPRIEDLQEIHYNAYLGQHVSTTEKSFHRWFWQEYNNKEKSCLENYDWNELWLCFVMNKVFDKKWNGQTWEVIK